MDVFTKGTADAINTLISEHLHGNDTDLVSDGSHTFGELYWMRAQLFACLINARPDLSFKSKLHDDGTMFDDYFIVGIYTPSGYFTFHYSLDFWNMFQCHEIPTAPAWDGHTDRDVSRLFGFPWEGWKGFGMWEGDRK